MMCWSARPKERPAARARLSTSAGDSRSSASRASARDFVRRSSRRSRLDCHCCRLSVQARVKRSSRARAAVAPHSMEGGRASVPEARPEAAAPSSTVRRCAGSKRRQSSSGAPGSRQTRMFAGEPRCRARISSILGGTGPPAPSAPWRSGRSTTSMLAQPLAESRMRSASTLSRLPRACAAACATLWSHAWDSGLLMDPNPCDPYRSSSAMGWRMPGATSSAAADVATPCSPRSAATSSRRAAMPPSRTHAGRPSVSSRAPSTSRMASSWLRTSLSATAIPLPAGCRCAAGATVLASGDGP
mmetsp:Transcript_43743/g.123848  ORF Transcript_43743/g.123848 Transcript_43743/m.123848 type:complete len:301 (+) Transcript_43743:1224-2126(+)